MGRKIVLTGTTLTDTTAPKLLSVDPIESDGSLLLVDMTHPSNPLVSGVPASDTALPNLLAGKATAIYGSTPANPRLAYANLDGTRGLVERTAKGGLHAIMSQRDAQVADASDPYLTIRWDAKFREWKYLHPNNDLYISLWGRITRAYRTGTVAGNASESPTVIYNVFFGGMNRYILNGREAAGGTLGQRTDNEGATGAKFLNTGNAALTGTLPATATDINESFVTVGDTGVRNYLPNADARWPSWIIYRLYVEDLTVSGRSYAEVDAIDEALYTKEVLTSGGRYYGDTYTDPATIP